MHRVECDGSLSCGCSCPCHRQVRCGAWMPNARESCARLRGHGWEHKTRYALDNASRMATGHDPRVVA